VARTSPKWIRQAAGTHLAPAPVIALDLGEDANAGVPCWSGGAQRWVQDTVLRAYRARYDTDVRPVMPHNPVSLAAVLAVAAARAAFADRATGRDCRPTNALLARRSGLSVRTVQRASTVLRLLGVATEVTRGRQRTLTERMASWRVGDKGRGWASVWVLHDSRIRPLSPHLRSGQVFKKTSGKSVLTTSRRKNAGHKRHDQAALALANSWVADRQSPPWARRYRTGAPWAPILTRPARHGWTARDVNQLLTDWVGTGHWLPEDPRRPIGLLGAVLAAHGDFEDRPAALDEAREQAALAAERRRIAAQLAGRDAHQRAREAGRQALGGAGHRAARDALAEIAARRRQKRCPPQDDGVGS
jgi:hypothetical protein